jgi:hypothetical protein
MQEPSSPAEPSDEQLLERLERDIAWLKSHGAWGCSFFERAVRRYVDARRSTRGLEDFVRRHGEPRESDA